MSRSTWDTPRACFGFAYGPFTLYGGTFQILQLPLLVPHRSPATLRRKRRSLGCFPFARHYLGNHGCFIFLRVLRCFTSPGFASPAYEFNRRSSPMTVTGLPHSEIHGSMRACRSPWLIAAYHVLHRLQMPRHSPCALSSLTKIWSHTSYHSSVKNVSTLLYAIVKELIPLSGKNVCCLMLIHDVHQPSFILRRLGGRA